MATFTGGVLANANGTGSNLALFTVAANMVASGALTICNTNATAAAFSITITHSGVTTNIRSGETLAPAGQAGDWQDFRALLLSAGDILTVNGPAGVHFTLVGHNNPASFTALDS